MITGFECSAGVVLLDAAGAGRAPCPQCLLARLREAGFEVNEAPIRRSEMRLPRAILNLLRRGVSEQTAPVVLVREGKLSQHVLLPFPDCPECQAQQREARPSSPVPRTVLRDPLLGITSGVTYRDPAVDSTALCHSVNGRVHLPLDATPEYAEGSGPDARSAELPQLAEAVERYSAFHPVTQNLEYARASELIGLCPPVKLFGGYDKRQLLQTGYQAIGGRDELAWIRGRFADSRRDAFVPAASVYLHRPWKAEVRFAPLVSTGAACHRSVALARPRAALEILERYETMRGWNEQRFGRLLPHSILPPSCEALPEHAARNGLTLVMRELSGPPRVPVAIAAISGSMWPWITFGSSAGFTTSEAVSKAAREAALAWQTLREWRGDLPERQSIAAVERPTTHMLLAARPDARRRFSEWLGSGPMARYSGERISSAAVFRQLAEVCPHAVEVVLTPPDCRMCGFEVVKIVAPGLPMLSFGSVGAPARFLRAHGIRRARSLHPFG